MGIEQFIIKEVTKLAMPLLQEKGIELVDLQYRRESTGWVLRLFIDKAGGVTVDDCAEVSRELGEHLDVKDIIPYNYHLEVSSPGVNRPLKKLDDFQKYTGHKVQIMTTSPVGDRRNFTGFIKAVNNDIILIEVDGKDLNIPFPLINKANLKEI
jgi:ribosome maturation factor RimP